MFMSNVCKLLLINCSCLRVLSFSQSHYKEVFRFTDVVHLLHQRIFSPLCWIVEFAQQRLILLCKSNINLSKQVLWRKLNSELHDLQEDLSKRIILRQSLSCNKL